MKEQQLYNLYREAFIANIDPHAQFSRIENSAIPGIPDLFVYTPKSCRCFWVEFKAKASVYKDGWLFRKAQWAWITNHIRGPLEIVIVAEYSDGVIYTKALDTVFGELKIIPHKEKVYVPIKPYMRVYGT